MVSIVSDIDSKLSKTIESTLFVDLDAIPRVGREAIDAGTAWLDIIQKPDRAIRESPISAPTLRIQPPHDIPQGHMLQCLAGKPREVLSSRSWIAVIAYALLASSARVTHTDTAIPRRI